MKKFEVNKKYAIHFSCFDGSITIECIKRTAKTVTFLVNNKEVRSKIYDYCLKEETAIINGMEVNPSSIEEKISIS